MKDKDGGNKHSDRDWKLWKRIKQVQSLQKSLDELFDNSLEMPTSTQIMKQYWCFSESKTSGLSFDEKKKALERYLNDLAANDIIATSEPFLKFIHGDDILDWTNKKNISNNREDVFDETYSPMVDPKSLTKS